ncbi:MAG: aminoacyl-tRNA hydrolase [Dongiaceae bacterium]
MESAGKPVAGVATLRRLGTKVLNAWREGRVLKAIGWRLLKLAPLYRALLLRRVTFIGITGSCGKTTAKELTAAVLATHYKGRRNPENLNIPPHVERTIMGVKPWDDYCLLELAPVKNDGERVFDRILPLVRPQIGVVTVIGTDHLSIYRSAEAVATEKGRLIEALPRRGSAVLNADDPFVRGMQSRCAGHVITYGQAADAVLRAENVSARWPERLSFTLRHEGQSFPVRTQLCGTHFLPSVLAALAVGHAMGIPLATAVEAVGTVPPFSRRMSPIDHPDGFTIIRDDAKVSYWSIPAALQVMREARATRRIVVLGTLSDYAGSSALAYVTVARQALEAADRVIFVGNASAKCLKAKRHPEDDALQAFYSPEAAAQHLRGWLRPGDLLLLKGSKKDRLDAIAEALLQPTDPGGAVQMATKAAASIQAVVGLGNPGGEYEETPHNVGRRVIDLLARTLHAEWTEEQDAAVARVERDGRTLYLIKPAARMNVTGPTLQMVGQRLGFGPAQCILVHDDLDLPIRSVRVRMRSGDGGHRGVRSVLQTFHTDEIRRVRIGVGRPAPGQPVDEYVLAPFAPATLGIIDEASTEAADRIFELLGMPCRIRGRAARLGMFQIIAPAAAENPVT